jgi:hypothetical protein
LFHERIGARFRRRFHARGVEATATVRFLQTSVRGLAHLRRSR